MRRLLALPDRTDWALGFICHDLAVALDATYDITVRECPKILEESLADEFDVIYVAYAHQYVKVPKRLRSRTVTGVHSYLEYHGARMRTFAHRVKHYAAVGCLAPSMKADICSLNGKVFWTPYGIPAEFSPADDWQVMPDGRLRIGWAGNPNWGGRRYIKNPDVLRRVAKRLGDVADVRWATDLPRDAMPDFYRGLDVLVVTSRSEGGPLPLMEALCCGIPVVTTHVGLADLHVQHGHNGWFFGRDPEGDENPDAELYRRLRWLARNPAAVHDAKVAAEAEKPLLRWPETSRYWSLLFDSV